MSETIASTPKSVMSSSAKGHTTNNTYSAEISTSEVKGFIVPYADNTSNKRSGRNVASLIPDFSVAYHKRQPTLQDLGHISPSDSSSMAVMTQNIL